MERLSKKFLSYAFKIYEFEELIIKNLHCRGFKQCTYEIISGVYNSRRTLILKTGYCIKYILKRTKVSCVLCFSLCTFIDINCLYSILLLEV